MSTEQNAEKAGLYHSTRTPRGDEQDEVLGMYAAGCRKCGWQGRLYDYADETRDAQRALARAEIREHKAGCDMWFEEDDHA